MPKRSFFRAWEGFSEHPSVRMRRAVCVCWRKVWRRSGRTSPLTPFWRGRPGRPRRVALHPAQGSSHCHWTRRQRPNGCLRLVCHRRRRRLDHPVLPARQALSPATARSSDHHPAAPATDRLSHRLSFLTQRPAGVRRSPSRAGSSLPWQVQFSGRCQVKGMASASASALVQEQTVSLQKRAQARFYAGRKCP